MLQALADGIEAFLGPEKIEKSFRIPDGPMNDQLLVEYDGPGNHGKINQNQQDQLDHRPGIEYQIQGNSPCMNWRFGS